MLRKTPTPGRRFLQVTGEDSGKDLNVSLLPTSPFCSLYKYQLLNDPLNSRRSPHAYKHLEEDVQITVMHRAVSASLGDAELQTKPGFICLLTERMGLLPFLTHLRDCKGLFNPADKCIKKNEWLKAEAEAIRAGNRTCFICFFFFLAENAISYWSSWPKGCGRLHPFVSTVKICPSPP